MEYPFTLPRTALLGDIILYESHLVLYKHSLDLIFYLIGPATENELMLNTALQAFFDAVSLLLRNQIEKRSVLENLDMVLLCLDETIDDGFVIHFALPSRSRLTGRIYEVSSSRPTLPRLHRESADRAPIPLIL